jgi:hypothetical protein
MTTAMIMLRLFLQLSWARRFLFYFTGTSVRQAKKVAYAGKVEKYYRKMAA